MPTASIDVARAWRGADLSPDDWTVALTDDAVTELCAVTEHLRSDPPPLAELSPDDFELAACRGVMTQVRDILDHSARFAVVDGLSLADLSPDDARRAFWLLSSMIARPVAQKLDGTMIYDVLDTGLTADAGTEIRPDKTNTEIAFHNDNGYGDTVPDYTCLLCLQTAKFGPRSLVMNVDRLHAELLQRYPDDVPRLYQRFWFDRVAEHAPDQPPVHAAPIFTDDGGLRVRMALHQLRNGYVLRDEALDGAGARAVAALEAVFGDATLPVEFFLERGQMQFLNNRTAVHRRTSFEDHDDPAKRRHLVRLWLRDGGARGYAG